MSNLLNPAFRSELGIFRTDNKGNEDLFAFQIQDLELVKKYGRVAQAIAHLNVAAPLYLDNPKEALSSTIMTMLYKPELRQKGIDYEGETARAFGAKLIFLDRYKHSTVHNPGRWFSALVAVDDFVYTSKTDAFHRNPDADANVHDFALEIVGKNGAYYLGIEPKATDLHPIATKTQ